MGRVLVRVKLSNHADLALKRAKVLKGEVRTVMADALVDTGATRLYLKTSIIRRLGLHRMGAVRSQTTNGIRRSAVYDSVHLELMGRSGNFDVVEVDESVPNLLGQIPLEYLDFVVDSRTRKLRPNPEHGGHWMAEEYIIRPSNA